MDRFNYIIAGGRVLDPASGLDAVMDVGICGNTVACMAGCIDRDDARIDASTKIIDASGALVTPGLVDLHCHFFPDEYYGLPPEDTGVLSGCTTMVDGGSAGMLTYEYFSSRYMEKSPSKAYAFILHHPIGQFFQEENWKNVSVNADATADFIRRHPRIVGLKDKLTSDFAWYQGVEGVRRAVDIAHKSGKPYAVHLGTSTRLVVPDEKASEDDVAGAVRACTLELLATLRKGDIIFHAFTGKLGAIFTADGAYDEAVRAAIKRGVLLDASVGRANFDIESYRLARQKGIVPDLISSDLVQFGLTDVVFNLGTALSKFIDNGLTLPEVIHRATFMPAQAIGLDDGTGRLRENGPADITISRLETGEFIFKDKMNGHSFSGPCLLRPQMCFVDGVPYDTKHHGMSAPADPC